MEWNDFQKRWEEKCSACGEVVISIEKEGLWWPLDTGQKLKLKLEALCPCRESYVEVEETIKF